MNLNAACPDCQSPMLTQGVPAPGKCLNCGWPVHRTRPDESAAKAAPTSPIPAPPKLSELARLRLVADVASELYLCRGDLARVNVHPDDKGSVAALIAALERIGTARQLLAQAGIPWPELPGGEDGA